MSHLNFALPALKMFIILMSNKALLKPLLRSYGSLMFHSTPSGLEIDAQPAVSASQPVTKVGG